MMGPSAPNGPPVPIAMAAEMGFRMATRGAMRLRLNRTASIASGMPCPLIFEVPYFAITPTISPPMTGVTMTIQPRWLCCALEKSVDQRWKKKRLVNSPISLYRANATRPATNPTAPARVQTSSIRKDAGGSESNALRTLSEFKAVESVVLMNPLRFSFFVGRGGMQESAVRAFTHDAAKRGYQIRPGGAQLVVMMKR